MELTKESVPMDKDGLRWMLRADLKRVIEIEKDSYAIPWHEADFISILADKFTVGRVYVDAGLVEGYIIYKLSADQIKILNFAVDPDSRSYGYGSVMFEWVKNDLCRSKVIVHVRETNMVACKFLRSCGFEAAKVIRGHYQDTMEDAYEFEYQRATS